MYVERLLFPIHTLGPGSRIALWTMGCPFRCSKCASPELWEVDMAKNLQVENLRRLIGGVIENNEVDGLTITGGEPFSQIDDLFGLLFALDTPKNFDVLVFTGYTLAELVNKRNKKIEQLLQKIDVLVDGRYMDEFNGSSALRGSDNQNIVYLNEGLRGKYEKYLQKGRQVQNIFYENALISVGIHNRSEPQR